MPAITSIKPQKDGKRVNIYLDGEYGFGLDLENFVKLGLKVEQEFTDEEIEKIIKKAEFQKVYDKILRFASLRPRSEKEYIGWLRKHKVHEKLHEELFNKLKYLEFLNDKKFAVWWIGQRQAFRPKSKRILSQELRLKGIKREIIDEVLSETKLDELGTAKKLLAKKKYLWERLNSREKRVKMSNYLVRNGFGWDVIREVLDM